MLLFFYQSPSEQAQQSKLRGNELFKAGKFNEAIECYSQAISICPEENKLELAVYYQNRAAAHEQLVSTNYTSLYML